MDGWAAVAIALLSAAGFWTFAQKAVESWRLARAAEAKKQLSLSEGWSRLSGSTQEMLEEERTRAAAVETTLRARITALETENAELKTSIADLKAENRILHREMADLRLRVERIEGRTPPRGTPAQRLGKDE